MMELLLRLEPTKQWYTAKEVAALLGRTDQFVRDLVENRRIFGHILSGRGEAKRKTYQIPRNALEIYLLETANFQPDDYLNCLIGLMGRLPRTHREYLRQKMRH